MGEMGEMSDMCEVTEMGEAADMTKLGHVASFSQPSHFSHFSNFIRPTLSSEATKQNAGPMEVHRGPIGGSLPGFHLYLSSRVKI